MSLLKALQTAAGAAFQAVSDLEVSLTYTQITSEKFFDEESGEILSNGEIKLKGIRALFSKYSAPYLSEEVLPSDVRCLIPSVNMTHEPKRGAIVLNEADACKYNVLSVSADAAKAMYTAQLRKL